MFRYAGVVTVLAIGLSLTLTMFLTSRRLEARRLMAEFDSMADDRAHAVRTQIRVHIDSLHALRGYFESSSSVSRSEFAQFTGTLLDWTPGTQALEWAPRIPESRRSEFERRAELEGLDALLIRERGADGALVPAAGRDTYFPVYYVEPRPGNEPALGFDLLSDPVRRRALEQARDSGKVIATEPIRLLQETGRQAGVLVFVPVFERPAGASHVDGGRLRGVVVGVLRIGDLLSTALFGLDPTGVNAVLVDTQAPPDRRRLAAFPENWMNEVDAEAPRSILFTDFRGGRNIEVAGRVWTIVCTPTSAFFAERSSFVSWVTLLAGLVVTLAATGYVSVSTHRTIAERALDESRERNRLILSNVLDAVVTFDRSGHVRGWNGLAELIFGWSEFAVIGRSLGDLILLDAWDSARFEECGDFLEAAGLDTLNRRVESVARHKDGREFPVEMAIVSMQSGTSEEYCAFVHDISERKKAEEALRESARRFRVLVDNAPEAVVVLDLDEMRFVDVNEKAVKLFKTDRATLLRHGPADMSPGFQPDGRPSKIAAREVLENAAQGGTPVFEWAHLDREGDIRMCEVRLVQLPSRSRRLIRGSITDISERKRAEERQALLVRELDHRVKNNLAAVLAIAERSLEGSHSLDSFHEAFTGRIGALSRLHEALARNRWEGVELGEIISLTLQAFSGARSQRVRPDGEKVLLGARESSSICMALHELTTNSSKYGAFSTAQGYVAIRWRARDGTLTIVWTERGGPPVKPPARQGFGMELIRGVTEYELSGSVAFEFAREGMTCRIEVPTESGQGASAGELGVADRETVPANRRSVG